MPKPANMYDPTIDPIEFWFCSVGANGKGCFCCCGDANDWCWGCALIGLVDSVWFLAITFESVDWTTLTGGLVFLGSRTMDRPCDASAPNERRYILSLKQFDFSPVEGRIDNTPALSTTSYSYRHFNYKSCRECTTETLFVRRNIWKDTSFAAQRLDGRQTAKSIVSHWCPR